MIKVAIIGYGNIGKYAVHAVEAAPDMELVGLVRRQKSLDEPLPAELADIRVTSDIQELGQVDVALLCVPTRAIPQIATNLLQQGINTIDSYDIHQDLADVRIELAKVAQENKSVAVISAGWDPGTDSLLRAMLELMAPCGLTYTNFGPGMSMGHTVAVKAIPGVADALSMTVPIGTGLHRRMVYVELEPGMKLADVSQKIKADPYFVNDETHVFAVPDITELQDVGHGVTMERKGVSGQTHNQKFTWEMRVNNPALTSQVMVAAARASMRQKPGAYTLLHIPLLDFLPGDEDEIIRRLV